MLNPVCPRCGGALVINRMEEVTELGGGHAIPGMYYYPLYECPNVSNHGTKVPCANGCGAQVQQPYAHRMPPSDGAIGPSRWNCVSADEKAAMERQLASMMGDAKPFTAESALRVQSATPQEGHHPIYGERGEPDWKDR